MNSSKKPWRSPAVDLPEDIVCEILLKLPVKCLLKFRCVCENWRDLIGSRRFIDLYLNHPQQTYLLLKRAHSETRNTTLSLYSRSNDDGKINLQVTLPDFLKFQHKKLEICGPCNGIILLGQPYVPSDRYNPCERAYHRTSPIYLCNPATREFRELPSRAIYEPFYGCSYVKTHSLGLGFDPCTNDYKAVSIMAIVQGNMGFRVSIYRLSSDSRSHNERLMPTVNVVKGEDPVNLNYAHESVAGSILDECGLFVKGCIHWRMRFPSKNGIILALNASDEVMRVVTLPREINGLPDALLVLEDCLALAVGFKVKARSYSIELWVKVDYANEESWMKRFCLPLMKLSRFLACWNDDMLLFEATGKSWFRATFKKIAPFGSGNMKSMELLIGGNVFILESLLWTEKAWLDSDE